MRKEPIQKQTPKTLSSAPWGYVIPLHIWWVNLRTEDSWISCYISWSMVMKSGSTFFHYSLHQPADIYGRHTMWQHQKWTKQWDMYVVLQEVNAALEAHFKHSMRIETFLPIIIKIYTWFDFEKSLRAGKYFLKSIHIYIYLNLKLINIFLWASLWFNAKASLS